MKLHPSSKLRLFREARESSARRRLYACCGCGDITFGAISDTHEYDCCADCCQRVDDAGLADDADRGPYRERGEYPKCPQCGGDTAPDPGEYRLSCLECMHHWTPPGIYTGDAEGGEA